MVQHYVSPVYVYKYPFETIMVAYVKRFPRTDRIPVMADSEIIEEEKSEDGLVIRTKRRCKIVVEAPYILKRVAGIDFCYFLQENVLNWKERTLTIIATNETFSSRVIVTEKCLYRIHNANSEWTAYEQEASIEFVNFFGFEAQCERLGMERYTQQIRKGKDIMDAFVQDVLTDGDAIPAPYRDPCRIESSSSQTSDGTTSEDQDLCEPSVCAETHPVVRHRKTNSIDTTKLNAEYIQRFLGALTPIQESNLIQLRALLASSRFSGQIPNDAVLLRFLKAREFNIEKARDMICQHLAWRKLYQVEQILQTWSQPEVIEKFYPGGWHHTDKDGHPVYVLRLGQMDVKGLFESVGEATITKQLLVFAEDGLKRCEYATRSSNKAIGTVTLVCDLEGLAMAHFWRPGLNCLDRLLQLFQNQYPETLGRLLFVRAPRIFPLLWALVFPFIDERTREKVYVSGGNDYMDAVGGIGNFLPEDCIPDFLGGPSQCSFSAGGPVPKRFFSDSPFDMDTISKTCGLETLYTSTNIDKEKPHEILIEACSHSVIMWDFDVVHGAVQFCVFRLADHRPGQVESDIEVPPSPSLSESDTSQHTSSRRDSSDSGTSGTSSIIGLQRAGRVLSFVLPAEERAVEIARAKVVVAPQVSYESENVQNTLAVSSHSGRYLLRWELADVRSSPSPTENSSDLFSSAAAQPAANVFRFSSAISSAVRKPASLMYYCEVLPSANVKNASDSFR